MRERLIDELGDLAHSRFLVYLMGPYQAFDVEAVLAEAAATGDGVAPDAIPESVDFGTFVGSDVDFDRDEAAMDLLLEVRDRLRTAPGVNAFLAVDIDIPLDEIDAATQSIEFARHSNATAFVLPFLGHNFGVGEEAGSILEALSETHGDRLIFVHEDNVTSAMIRSASVRWDVRVETYETEAELASKLRLFVGEIMHRERRGELDQPK